MYKKVPAIWWIMLICLVAILYKSVMKWIDNGAVPYMSFGIASSLMFFILNDLPIFAKRKYIPAIFVLGSVILVFTGIITSK